MRFIPPDKLEKSVHPSMQRGLRVDDHPGFQRDHPFFRAILDGQNPGLFGLDQSSQDFRQIRREKRSGHERKREHLLSARYMPRGRDRPSAPKATVPRRSCFRHRDGYFES
jgi:hypothetical protein